MFIKELFQFLPAEVYEKQADLTIQQIHYDSRKIKKGDLFIAIKGYSSDGHEYIDDVLKKGAFVVAQKGLCPVDIPNVFYVEDSRKALALISKAYFGCPDDFMKVIGITGTNGKTTTTYMLKGILEEMGIKTGIIGTIQHMVGNKIIKAKNTTPESFEIYKMLREMKDNDVNAVAIEISSHALVMNRCFGLDLDVAVFTNLTQDHLDFHDGFEDYLNAKLSIFNLLKISKKPQKEALINYDIPQYKQIASYIQGLKLPFKTYGLNKNASYRGSSITMNIYHNIFEVFCIEQPINIDTPMLGQFNIYNALAAISTGCFFYAGPEHVQRGLKGVSVYGRFEALVNSLGFAVVIDYAHTPDALRNVLESARELKPMNIITVFGAGGDRDTKKRPLMGEVSRNLSNYNVITSDNPRSENPLKIIKQIETAFKNCKNYKIVEDREQAIKEAIYMADEGDIVIIAGKGHEDYQIFKDKTIHFSDKEMAEKYIKERNNSEKN